MVQPIMSSYPLPLSILFPGGVDRNINSITTNLYTKYAAQDIYLEMKIVKQVALVLVIYRVVKSPARIE